MPGQSGASSISALPPSAKICIIGAGSAGLITCKTLSVEGYDCTVYEKAPQLGGVWHHNRYPGVALQAPIELYEIADFPFAPATPKYPSGAEVRRYFERYAANFRIIQRIEFNRETTGITKGTGEHGGEAWLVETRHSRTGDVKVESFDFVVICTGMYNRPRIPDIPGLERIKSRVKHTSQCTQSLSTGTLKTVVVGYGKSAIDIAFSSAKKGAEVDLVARHIHWPIPRHLAGVDAKWATMSRFAVSFLPPYQRQVTREMFLHRFCCCLLGLPYRVAECCIKLKYNAGSVENVCIPKCVALACEEEQEALVPEETDSMSELWVGGFTPEKEFYMMMRDGRFKLHVAP